MVDQEPQQKGISFLSEEKLAEIKTKGSKEFTHGKRRKYKISGNDFAKLRIRQLDVKKYLNPRQLNGVQFQPAYDDRISALQEMNDRVPPLVSPLSQALQVDTSPKPQKQ